MTTGNFNALKQALATANTYCIGDVFTVKGFKAIHIMFAEKPDTDLLKTLKTMGFHWYSAQGTWSIKYSEKAEKWARWYVHQQNVLHSYTSQLEGKVLSFPKNKVSAKTEKTALTFVEEVDRAKTVKTVADTVKVPAKAVKKQVKAVKAVKTNAKKANIITERDGIKVGDIFYDVHGYNMTWYNFYKVIGFKGQKTVVFAQIEKKQVDGSMGMYGNVVPVDQYFYHDYRNTGVVEKIVKEGGKTPVFKGGNLYRHVAGRTYYENHLD